MAVNRTNDEEFENSQKKYNEAKEIYFRLRMLFDSSNFKEVERIYNSLSEEQKTELENVMQDAIFIEPIASKLMKYVKERRN